MLKLRKVRDLRLTATAAKRPYYVYAASGLVELRGEFFVVADDEMQIAIFPCNSDKPGRWMPLLPGELPADYTQRKKEKPDLESLTILAPYKYAPHGALLVMPSLSRRNRTRGALLVLNEKGMDEPIPIDFSHIYETLSAKIAELNIEGVVLSEKSLKLFHRGSKGNSKSSIIELESSAFLSDLHDTHEPDAKRIVEIRQYDLGQRDGIDLAFTDASNLPDGRIIFLASAEDSKNAYDDGSNAGSAVGILNEKLEIVRSENIEGRLKLEGICAKRTGSELSLMMVTDSDDEKIPSVLFAATWAD